MTVKYYVMNVDTSYIYVLELMGRYYKPLELINIAGQKIRILGYA